MEWIRQNYCYDLLKGKNIDFSIFVAKFSALNPIFWQKVVSLVYGLSLEKTRMIMDVFKQHTVSRFDKDYIQSGFKIRAEPTIDYISKKIIKSDDDSITSNSGEYVISELARKTIVSELGECYSVGFL